MEDQNLYITVKKNICRMIFDGSYPEGTMIPPERQLCETLGVSRVTLRKALSLLEAEGIIEKVQGSGTKVVLNFDGHKGNMRVITLVAPAQNAFFSKFIDAFETEAQAHDCLVLFKQKPSDVTLQDCLYQLYDRDLQNIVLWLEDMTIGEEYLRLLRGLGMNLVFFDAVDGGAYADAVSLDNHDAIHRLYQKLKNDGCKRIGYVGWDNFEIGSVRERQKQFLEDAGAQDAQIINISYRYHNRLEKLPQEMIDAANAQLAQCDGVIYSLSEFAKLFEDRAKTETRPHRAAAVDDLPEMMEEDGICIRQDFAAIAKKILECLEQQNSPETDWGAQNYFVKGIM